MLSRTLAARVHACVRVCMHGRVCAFVRALCFSTLCCTASNYRVLRCDALHCIVLRCSMLRCVPLRCAEYQCRYCKVSDQHECWTIDRLLTAMRMVVSMEQAMVGAKVEPLAPPSARPSASASARATALQTAALSASLTAAWLVALSVCVSAQTTAYPLLAAESSVALSVCSSVSPTAPMMEGRLVRVSETTTAILLALPTGCEKVSPSGVTMVLVSDRVLGVSLA